MIVAKLRKDFPFFRQSKHSLDLVYFDNAATSQKPQAVIDVVTNFYVNGCANVHRAIYGLGERATNEYNLARQKVSRYINSQFGETIFTSGSTEGINFIANSWGRKFIRSGDEIIVSIMEHHANFVTWQQLAKDTGAILKIINLTVDYQLDLDQYQKLLNYKTKLVAVTQVSNVLGTVNNLEEIIRLAKQFGAAVLVDAAQSTPYLSIDVQKLNCDFLVFSGHKMLAPDGVGILYIKQIWHNQIEPYQFGGGMVSDVSASGSLFLQPPEKFEAGTMPIASILGLAKAIDYYNDFLPSDLLKNHLAALCARLIEGLTKLVPVKIIGNQMQLKTSGHLVSFVVDGLHAHDIAAYLNQFGISVRAGHHCAQPLHTFLGLTATVRVSFHIYNTLEEVDYFLTIMSQLLEQGF